MTDTLKNLKEAFAGESQANQKYRAFAKQAEKDGFTNIARLFRMTAEAERIHAEGHLKAMEEIGSTAENLQTAIDGETYEFTHLCPVCGYIEFGKPTEACPICGAKPEKFVQVD